MTEPQNFGSKTPKNNPMLVGLLADNRLQLLEGLMNRGLLLK